MKTLVGAPDPEPGEPALTWALPLPTVSTGQWVHVNWAFNGSAVTTYVNGSATGTYGTRLT